MFDSISKAGPEPSASHGGQAVGATAGQWPEKKPMWPDRRLSTSSVSNTRWS